MDQLKGGVGKMEVAADDDLVVLLFFFVFWCYFWATKFAGPTLPNFSDSSSQRSLSRSFEYHKH